MNYECEIGNGLHLELGNDGDRTTVSFSRRGDSQQQSQGNGFSTGEWSKKPEVFQRQGDHIVRLATNNGSRFFQITGDRATLLTEEPDLAQASEVKLHESSEGNRMQPMKPMEPMRPVEPMAPMKPMRPMH